jgi:hypothetical protein
LVTCIEYPADRDEIRSQNSFSQTSAGGLNAQ